MTQEGPDNQAVHTATAIRECHRDITLSSASARGLNLIDSPRYFRGQRDGHLK